MHCAWPRNIASQYAHSGTTWACVPKMLSTSVYQVQKAIEHVTCRSYFHHHNASACRSNYHDDLENVCIKLHRLHSCIICIKSVMRVRMSPVNMLLSSTSTPLNAAEQVITVFWLCLWQYAYPACLICKPAYNKTQATSTICTTATNWAFYSYQGTPAIFVWAISAHKTACVEAHSTARCSQTRHGSC